MKRKAFMYLAVVFTCLFSVALAMSVQGTAGQNQSGPTVNERSEFQIGLCRDLGGIDSVDTVRTPASGLVGVKVTCKGGLLGGMTCFNDLKSSFCVWAKAGQTVPDNVRPVDAVDFLDLPLLTELPAGAGAALTPEVAEQPMLVEAVVTWNASSIAAHDNGLAQVNGCHLLGGEAIVNGDAAASDAQAFTVQCVGGMLDGLWCTNGTGPAMCFFLPPAEAVVETTGVPLETAAAPEQPTEAMPTEPTPTEAMPTEPAPTPSPTATMPAMPTEAPAEPTVAPTSGDGPWLPPHFEDLPPLEPAEPAPSPTEAPLT